MQKIVTNLWFDTQAEEAARFYVSLFPNSRIVGMSRYGEHMPMPAGTVLTVNFELDGQTFTALNAGPQFPFTEAISLLIQCEDQAEIDRYWDALIADGGQESVCGWLKDKYGLSWQVVPKIMDDYLLQAGSESDPAMQRMMAAMLGMKKLDVAALLAAYAGEPVA